MIVLIRQTKDGWALDTTGTPFEKITLETTGTTWLELPFTLDSDPEKVKAAVEEQTKETVIIL